MIKTNLEIVKKLKKYLYNIEERRKYIKGKNSFTRNRKMPFELMIVFMLNMIKKTLSVELLGFYKTLEKVTQKGKKVTELVTKSGFSQGRKKLCGEFFKSWNRVLVKEYYTDNDGRIKKWRGKRLAATDGTTLYLINKAEIKEEFGVQRNQTMEVPMAQVICSYDVMNDIFLDSRIMPIAIGELQGAIDNLESFEKDMVMIYDRAYPSFGFMYIHIKTERDFVIRAPEKFNNEIKAFSQTKLKETTVKLPATERGKAMAREFGFKIGEDEEIEVRLIKVFLKKSTEILITSLLDKEEYPASEFKDLYRMRWEVETSFDRLKNKLQVESFSGHSAEAIRQDFYAAIFISNLQTLLIDECSDEVDEKSLGRKYQYAINRNVSIGLMKDRIIEIFLSSDPAKVIEDLKSEFIKFLEPIRPDRSFEHKRKSKRTKGKYQTHNNYRRSI